MNEIKALFIEMEVLSPNSLFQGSEIKVSKDRRSYSPRFRGKMSSQKSTPLLLYQLQLLLLLLLTKLHLLNSLQLSNLKNLNFAALVKQAALELKNKQK